MQKLPRHDQTMPFPILMGDIGGTNARFSILESVDAERNSPVIVKTEDYETIDEAISKAILNKAFQRPKSVILAIAGPIKGDEIALTNCKWVVKPRQLISDMGFEDVLVINDFEAQALAVATLSSDHLVQIGPGVPLENASRAVLGPGTGLGVAGLVHAKNIWIPIPGEGGHVDVGPRTSRDSDIFPYLDRIDGRISAEQLLCGRGLVNIYRAICSAKGETALLVEPAEVSSHALAETNPEAMEALSLFVTYLGRVAGDMAMVFMARGGVYLAGGISQIIIPALKKAEFRAAFEDKAPHRAWLRETPTYVITHPFAALAGLATYALAPARFGVSTDGRRWQA